MATTTLEPGLALFGGTPTFSEPLHVGRPNLGDRARFLSRVQGIFDRGWLSNNGPLVQEFEGQIAAYTNVRHCVATCNATVALEIAACALNLSGEVIMPAYTFVATAHALQWQGITPIFADIDASHCIDPSAIEQLITPRTSAIMGVHVWGRACDTDALTRCADAHGLPLLFDAAHAFGCSHNGTMIGGFGTCEVFSFHATKFIHSFEGGAIVTNDDALAARARLMRNFGFAGPDQVVSIGINGKMPEVSAAMGLCSLEVIDELIAINRANHAAYTHGLQSMPGLRVIEHNPTDRQNYQYIVVEVDPDESALTRDEFVEVLHAENVLARKYFWPGVHRMEPYRTRQPHAVLGLSRTEQVAASVLVLPTGQATDLDAIRRICAVMRRAYHDGARVRAQILAHPRHAA